MEFINRPITEKEFTDECRREFLSTGILAVSNFIKSQFVDEIKKEILSRKSDKFKGESNTNIFQSSSLSEEYEDDHVLNRFYRTTNSCLSGKSIPNDFLVRKIYQSGELKDFVSKVVGLSPIYHLNDPVGDVTVNWMDEGDEIGWHFDQANFVVILIIQKAGRGGVYEVAPKSRFEFDSGENDYERQMAVLDGNDQNIIKLAPNDCELIIHDGFHSLHRITKVTEDPERITCLLSYGDEQDRKLDDECRMMFYGTI
jgi:hypothetical protein